MGFCHPCGMAHTLLISSIRRKRALLVGQIEQAARALAKQRRDLKVIDGTLRLLDHGYDPGQIIGIRPFQRMEGFRHGELTRITIDLLRVAGGPLSAPEIAEGLALRKGTAVTRDLVVAARANAGRMVRAGRLRKTGVRRQLKWGLPD
jgi:hypothetical protein